VDDNQEIAKGERIILKKLKSTAKGRDLIEKDHLGIHPWEVNSILFYKCLFHVESP